MSSSLSKILKLALIFTFISGLYVVSSGPEVLDAEFLYFGFPLAWLEAGRSTWHNGLWFFYPSLWGWGFIIDFAVYLMVSSIVLKIHTNHSQKFQRGFFWTSFLLLVSSCWTFILWMLGADYFSVRLLRELFPQFTSIIIFLLGVSTIAFTWSLKKHRKEVAQWFTTNTDK